MSVIWLLRMAVLLVGLGLVCWLTVGWGEHSDLGVEVQPSVLTTSTGKSDMAIFTSSSGKFETGIFTSSTGKSEGMSGFTSEGMKVLMAGVVRAVSLADIMWARWLVWLACIWGDLGGGAALSSCVSSASFSSP